MKIKKIIGLVFALMLIPAAAYAHLTHEVGGGVLTGFLHPIFGMDHLLAMLTVGLLSGLVGGRGMWMIPASFVGVMIIGGIFGINGLALPLVEYGIAASVLFLGVTLAIGKKFSLLATMVLAGLFGLFHGHAHGTEMPLAASPILYAIGFSVATIGLHILGAVIGHFACRTTMGTICLRLSGFAVASIGLVLIIGM